MTKLLFVIKYPLEAAYTIKKKVDGQTAAAARLGLDVWQTAYDRQHAYLLHQGQKQPLKRILLGNMPGYIHTKAFWDLFGSVLRALRRQSFDYAYMRHCPIGLRGYRMLRRLSKSGCKTVVEIPSYPLENERQKSLPRRLYWAYSQFWWRQAAKYVSRFALIGAPADSYLHRPAVNIDNGVDVDGIPLRRHEPAPDGKLHFLAVAAMARWHGFDRIIEGVAQLPDDLRSKVVVDMAGSEGDGSLARWQQLAAEKGLSEQIIFHGYQTGEGLDALFARADAGVCSLGLHRNGYRTASHLKLREYTARGLPFLYAADDPALTGEEPFCLQIPADDSPVPMQQVIRFAQDMRARPDLPQQMREYARQHMSWEKPLRQALDGLPKP